ncbi:MAG: T9SS type A sorting domain-containing protein [candidate division WOR-3 bacterium]
MFIIFFLILQDTLIRWEPEVNLSQDTSYNFYPWIECLDSFVHIVWNSQNGYVYYRRSTDLGVSWDSVVQLNDSAVTIIYPQIALSGSFVHCIWWEFAQDGRLRYRRSLDRGQTWDTLCILGPSAHRHFIIAKGLDVYVITGKSSPDLGLFLLKSTDGGSTWSSCHKISSRLPDYEVGFFINEKFHLAFTDDADSVYYMYSTDLGETWSEPLQIAVNPDAPKCHNIVANDYGYLFIPWEDNKYSGGVLDDVLLRRSTDNGLTWLPEQQITNHHLVDMWDDICCADSDVYLVWPKDGSSQEALQFRASTDMGETWWPIEDICNNLVFDGSVATDFPKIHIVWRDRRSFPSEIYYRRGTRLPVGIEETRRQREKETGRIEVWPNPFRNYCVIQYALSSKHYAPGEVVSVKMYDVLGKEVMSLRQRDKETEGRGEIRIETKGLPPGVYFVQVESGSISEIKKTVKIE